ncbi:hypothetical protein UA08_07376 [Talaromyces atroroseus]|uniref:Zn(2)-C6 fungal-type domain-containing protein n=1 Tax=Talaromyces atroroseus TaxID=1441469 RepID=A0A225AN75_TALAT|nr:hypothetical protein UA08_07376 [Talaromyces atroroseus]OKL57049.1 hypothetical protein UA08_07376 [Talaromyces atroroseus]
MANTEGQGINENGPDREPASTFSSNDDPKAKVPKLRATCDACQAAKSRCSRGNPCFRCMHHGVQCKYSPSKRIGRPQRNTNESKNEEKEENPPKRKKKAADSNLSSRSCDESKDHRASISTTPSLGHSTVSSAANTISSALSTLPSALGDTGSWMDAVGDPQSLDGDTINLSSLYSDEMDVFSYPIAPNFQLPSLDFVEASIAEAAFDNAVGHALNTKNLATREAGSQTPRIETGQQPGSSIPGFNNNTSASKSTVTIHPTEIPNIRLPLFPEEAAVALSNNSSAASLGCDCYRSILSRLLDFEDSRKNSLTMAIDLILTLNRRTQDLSDKVLQCQTHSTHRPDLLLLLAIAIDNVLCILESVLNHKKRHDVMTRFNIQPVNLSPPGLYSGGGNSSSMQASHAGPPTKCNAKELIFMKLIDSRPLLIGNVEISPDEKVDFGMHDAGALSFAVKYRCFPGEGNAPTPTFGDREVGALGGPKAFR